MKCMEDQKHHFFHENGEMVKLGAMSGDEPISSTQKIGFDGKMMIWVEDALKIGQEHKSLETGQIKNLKMKNQYLC